MVNNLSSTEQTVVLGALPETLGASCGTLVVEELFTQTMAFVAPKQPFRTVLAPFEFHWYLVHG